jgi:hypothetical protein
MTELYLETVLLCGANVACDNVDAEKRSEPEIAAVVKTEHVPSRKHEGDQNLSKDLIAELNVFLAHAPAVERCAKGWSCDGR